MSVDRKRSNVPGPEFLSTYPAMTGLKVGYCRQEAMALVREISPLMGVNSWHVMSDSQQQRHVRVRQFVMRRLFDRGWSKKDVADFFEVGIPTVERGLKATKV